MLTAFVLIDAEPARVAELAEEVAAVEGVAESYSVAGQADIVAVVRVRHIEELADVVTRRLHALPGVTDTRTLVAFQSYSRRDLDAMWELGRRLRHAGTGRPPGGLTIDLVSELLAHRDVGRFPPGGHFDQCRHLGSLLYSRRANRVGPGRSAATAPILAVEPRPRRHAAPPAAFGLPAGRLGRELAPRTAPAALAGRRTPRPRATRIVELAREVVLEAVASWTVSWSRPAGWPEAIPRPRRWLRSATRWRHGGRRSACAPAGYEAGTGSQVPGAEGSPSTERISVMEAAFSELSSSAGRPC